jgi:hypothetical protein
MGKTAKEDQDDQRCENPKRSQNDIQNRQYLYVLLHCLLLSEALYIGHREASSFLTRPAASRKLSHHALEKVCSRNLPVRSQCRALWQSSGT